MKFYIKFIILIFFSTSIYAEEKYEIEIISENILVGRNIIKHSWVNIEYKGYFENGDIFDTNIGKDKPLVVQMNMKEVIPGFEKGLIGLTEGSTRIFKIPPQLAYGEAGAGELIPPNAVLNFEINILGVIDPGYKTISNEELLSMIGNNAIVIDMRTKAEWEATGIIKGSFPLTAFAKDGKFNTYFMDQTRTLAGEDAQDVKIIFISDDGETASILANAFSEDLGFSAVHILDKGIKGWLNDNREVGDYK